MFRNIDLIFAIQEKVQNFNILNDELSIIIDTDEVDMFDLIENGDSIIIDILNTINDVGKILDLLTEDIRSSMLEAGFDCDDFKMWNAKLWHCPLNLEGLLETFEGAFEVLEFYVIETVRGYKILTQLAYDINPRLPGVFKKAEKS